MGTSHHCSAHPVAGCIHRPVTTLRPETLIKPGGSLANAREPSREKRRTERWERAQMSIGGHTHRSRDETANPPPILAFQAKKIPTDKGWDLVTWWSRGE